MLDYSILKGKASIELPYDYLTGATTKCKDLLSKVIDTDNIQIIDFNIYKKSKFDILNNLINLLFVIFFFQTMTFMPSFFINIAIFSYINNRIIFFIYIAINSI